MRKQQLALRALGLATVLGIGAAYAGDGPTGAPPVDKGKPDSAERGKPHPGKPDHAAEEASKRADVGKGPQGAKGADGRGPGRPGVRELATELSSGKLKKTELKERLDDLRQTREERAKEHREELNARFGPALATPAAREELEHHARRIAKLNRALVVAETEITKDKDKLKERIQKLVDKENTRHQQAMARFQAGPPGAAAAPSAAPPAPPAVVAAEKGAEK